MTVNFSIFIVFMMERLLEWNSVMSRHKSLMTTLKKILCFNKILQKNTEQKLFLKNKVEEFIKRSESGEIGLPHFAYLGKGFKIVKDGRVIYRDGDDVVFEYDGFHYESPLLMRKNRKKRKNECFLDVLRDQKGEGNLRKNLIENMIKDKENLTGIIEEVLFLEKYDKEMLMMGGARYDGRNADDAGEILDASQGQRGHGARYLGHPRAHVSNPDANVSNPDATESIDCVERYSIGVGPQNHKSGFFNRNDQNRAVHSALVSSQGQQALNRLNGGSTKDAFDHNISALNIRMGKWARGEIFEEKDADYSKVVLMHKEGQVGNQNADVFVHTCYPH